MTRWLVSFDATISVSVEAETEEKAVAAAERTLNALGIDNLCLSEDANCSVGRVITIKDEQTGVEIRK